MQVCAHEAARVAAAGELQGERGAPRGGSGRFCGRCACMLVFCMYLVHQTAVKRVVRGCSERPHHCPLGVPRPVLLGTGVTDGP